MQFLPPQYRSVAVFFETFIFFCIFIHIFFILPNRAITAKTRHIVEHFINPTLSSFAKSSVFRFYSFCMGPIFVFRNALPIQDESL